VRFREDGYMLTIENRVQRIEDRAALQDVLTAYCNAVDSLSDMDGLLNCFTEDAVLDLSGVSIHVRDSNRGRS
jgi:hypothetical protein